jgi:hypothetical protein
MIEGGLEEQILHLTKGRFQADPPTNPPTPQERGLTTLKPEVLQDRFPADVKTCETSALSRPSHPPPIQQDSIRKLLKPIRIESSINFQWTQNKQHK